MQKLCKGIRAWLWHNMKQMNLLGQIIEKPKPQTPPSGCNDKTFEEHEREIAQRYYGRKHIGYPCDIAQDMHIDDRPQHIKNCPDCQELIKKLDMMAYGKSN